MRPRAVALTRAADVASAAAAALLRLRRRRTSGARRARASETHRCECGEAFRVAGSGRHRVYWRAGAPDGEPLLAARCPSCDRPLRAEREAAVGGAG
jgi:hypothetical protein